MKSGSKGLPMADSRWRVGFEMEFGQAGLGMRDVCFRLFALWGQ